jgi:hypothetical protein
METISRHVDELRPQERSAVEMLLGHSLRGTERLILQIVDVDEAQPPTQDSRPDELLPAWCNVYEGLTDEEMEKIGESILRCNLTRSFE